MTTAHEPVPHTVLGQNQYGKAEVRVVRVVRSGAVHHLQDLSVSVALSGDMEEVHRDGRNAGVLPTDTVRNTVHVFAKEQGIVPVEEFGIRLARHFVTSQPSIRRARVLMEEYRWERIARPSARLPHTRSGTGDSGGPVADARHGPGRGHSFVRHGGERRLCRITYDGTDWQAVSGLDGLTVMNTTGSEFHGYVKDPYTTLAETRDRLLATDIRALWRHGPGAGGAPPDWDTSYREIRGHILAAFADTYSYSLQQTLYAMGARVLEERAEIDEIRFSLPNKHHFPVDLEPFGLANDNEVFFAADRPYGLIEATVLRPGAEALLPPECL
jgi:urate oxidase